MTPLSLGPIQFLDKWPSLKAAAFDRIDAILPNLSDTDEAYFFSGNRYALISVKPGVFSSYHLPRLAFSKVFRLEGLYLNC